MLDEGRDPVPDRSTQGGPDAAQRKGDRAWPFSDGRGFVHHRLGPIALAGRHEMQGEASDTSGNGPPPWGRHRVVSGMGDPAESRPPAARAWANCRPLWVSR